jgi:23S rRNA pseudouridine1911/1915/1917 synthase
MAADLSLTVLFEDNHCLVVSKPPRLLTASDKTGDETLIERARAYNAAQQADGRKGYLAPLHMLDRPVSGAVMFAKSSKAASRLAEQFRAGRISKVYNALVEGRAPAPEGVLEDWLVKDRRTNVVTPARRETPGAKACRLDYRVLGAAGGLTWVEVRPRTGRSHQIRVQLAARGMPIYGDTKYGASCGWDGVIALHAVAVTFEHPVSKAPVTVRAPLPPAWRELWPGELDVQEA